MSGGLGGGMRGTTWLMDEDKHENHWRRTFCQIPFPAIYEHAENGKRSLHRLVEFFRRKAEAERGANEELRSVIHVPIDGTTSAHLEDLEEPGSSVRKALAEVKGFVDTTCHQQLLLAKVLEEQVAEPLVSLQDASEMYIRTLQGEIRNVNDAYAQALSLHGQAAARLRKARSDLADAKERQRIALHGIGVPEFELQRLAVRVHKCDDEVAQAELEKAQAKTLLYNRIISRDEMAMAVSVAYQKAEEERLDQLNSCLQRFLHIERERLKVAERMLQSLEGHIKSVSRSEDIQLLIHNHRNPDNMHFQGKALALLDWHWGKMLADQERKRTKAESTDHGRGLSLRGTSHHDRAAMFVEPIDIPTFASHESVENAADAAPSAIQKSPHGALADSPMGRALHELFATDSQPNTPVKASKAPTLPRIQSDAGAEVQSMEGSSSEDSADSVAIDPVAAEDIDIELLATAEELERTRNDGLIPSADTSKAADATSEAEGASSSDAVCRSSLEEIVTSTCQTQKGRALFVKCMNRQRSLETRLKDQASFDALVRCFDIFLDHCMREDDVKAAKTAMILAETFYAARKVTNPDQGVSDQEEPPRRERGGSWGFASHTIGRGRARMYLQEEVKKHAIWTNPSFWEKALLLAIGEELQRTPQPCAWEDLPSGIARQSSGGTVSGSGDGTGSSSGSSSGQDGGLYSREEAVSRVHNIVFGQLGSFTLSMLEFDVPFVQIESFVETMCDAHELTEDQRFLLRKNLQEIFATLK